MKKRVTFEIDGGAFFDAVKTVGQETTGHRLLGTFLAISTADGAGFGDHLGLSIYGIEIVKEEVVPE